jgi:hypothetical protein
MRIVEWLRVRKLLHLRKPIKKKTKLHRKENTHRPKVEAPQLNTMLTTSYQEFWSFSRGRKNVT